MVSFYHDDTKQVGRDKHFAKVSNDVPEIPALALGSTRDMTTSALSPRYNGRAISIEVKTGRPNLPPLSSETAG